MIISVSRRTDIPAFYGEWFLDRLREGFVMVPQPFRPLQIRRVSLHPNEGEVMVFWSKNPAPFLPLLPEVDRWGWKGRYVFHFTLNPYEATGLEENIPPLKERIATFQHQASLVGPERAFWRYDHIIFTRGRIILDTDFHLHALQKILYHLHQSTRKVVVSFLDRYRKNQSALKKWEKEWGADIVEPSIEKMKIFSMNMVKIAASYGIAVFSCAEEEPFRSILSDAGILPGSCIDAWELEKILPGMNIPDAWKKKDPGQRKACRCTISQDIGTYNTCKSHCRYCYATHYSENMLKRWGTGELGN
ncbi:MAG: DUF1848 domain-containing protein [Candidatus Atribacteria bacterium]|nr:DUF1848 domain-containing protein [Candidatus Atribacteria bacterium]